MGNAASYCGTCSEACCTIQHEEAHSEYKVVASKDYLKIREYMMATRSGGDGPRIVCHSTGR